MGGAKHARRERKREREKERKKYILLCGEELTATTDVMFPSYNCHLALTSVN